MHQGSVLLPFLFAVVVDVFKKFAGEVALSELLHVDDLVLMSETIEVLRNKFLNERRLLRSRVLKLTLGGKVMVSSSIKQDGLSKSKVDACGVCSLRAKANSALYLLCGKWIYGRCTGVKMVNPKFLRNFACGKCEGNIGEAVEQEEKLCDELETVREFTYHGDSVSEAAVIARTRCGWVAV